MFQVQDVFKESLIVGVFQCCAAVCQDFAGLANVLLLLLLSKALFVCGSFTLAPPCTTR